MIYAARRSGGGVVESRWCDGRRRRRARARCPFVGQARGRPQHARRRRHVRHVLWEAGGAALAGLATRGITQAVLQPHVEGDLVKFYGIGSNARPDGTPAWFRSFYHQNQTLRRAPARCRCCSAGSDRAAATALGLEVYGGDAIATAGGRTRAAARPQRLAELRPLPRGGRAERIAEHLERSRFAVGQRGRLAHERAP